ncbi:MAG: hypothetical protein ACRDA0_03865 [Cetobacterium sp.]|uniref:hypothetical protein n=1 Tax=Cetobacterium sp. TaxID=2071632 RepID=UPI003F3AC8EF
MKNIFFLFFAIFNLTFSYVNIHPTFFDKRIDFNGSYQEYTLFNQSSNTVLYRIYVEPHSKGSNKDMSDWVNFYPRSLTLKPGESGKIQVDIASKKKLEAGEYSAVLGIRELPIYEKVVSEKGAGLSILTDLKLVLNGYAGDINPNLQFSNLNVDINKNTITLNGSVKNIGKRRGKYELYLDEYFLGNLRIHSNEKLDLNALDFKYSGEIKNKLKKELLIIDYIDKKPIGKIKL